MRANIVTAQKAMTAGLSGGISGKDSRIKNQGG